MHLFKKISVQLVLKDHRSVWPKVTIMLKYQMEINNNIWFCTVDKLGPNSF